MLVYPPPPLPSLGGGGGVSKGSKIIGNKTNPMNIQSNLNVKYHINVHCTDSMHFISIRKVQIENFRKRGNKPQHVSIVMWPSPKICIFWFLVQRHLQQYIWLRRYYTILKIRPNPYMQSVIYLDYW